MIASLLFMGGLRRSEVSALEWRDVSDARDGDGVLLTVRTSKTNQEGDAADVRYLKNGAANAIRTLRAAAADAAPTDRGDRVCPRYRFSAGSPRPPAPPASKARVTAHSGGDGGTARHQYGITRASLRDEFPLSGDRFPHLRTTSTPQHSGEWSLQCVKGVLFVLLARRVSDRAPLFSRGVRHVRQNPQSAPRHPPRAESAGKCTLSARAARRKFGPLFAVRKSCARVVSASLHAVTFDAICSSEVRAIHSSRARLRLTHLCRADQRSQYFTVVTSGPDDIVLTWC